MIKKFFPSKYKDITHVAPCCYSVTPGEEFTFERRDKCVYAFGLNGRGFKHLPYHGKRIYNLIKGDQKEADKYKRGPETPHEPSSKPFSAQRERPRL